MCIVNLNVVKLGEIASISSGLVTKRKQAMNNDEIKKQYRVLTLKSFEQNGWLNSREIDVFDSGEVLDEKYLSRKGDVIVRLSNPNTAIAIDEENVGILITSLFAIIRLDTQEVLPKYLSIFLNSDLMKKIYAKSSVGSAIQIIKTSILKNVEVLLKSIEKQKQIVKINELITRERVLLEALLDEKIKYHHAVLSRIINNSSD